MTDAPKLLIEWSSPWEEFVTAIKPALAKSPERLAGEAHTGLFPYRGMALTWGGEILLLIAIIFLPEKLQSLRPYTPTPLPKYDVIYYSGDELPQTEDAGGAQSGKSGTAGGSEARHQSQTIRVSRGSSLTDKVVDAPKLNLPQTNLDVANLLAIKPIPGPAPVEGLKRSSALPTLPQMNPIAPMPDVALPALRTSPAVNTGIVAPAPMVSHDKLRNAPSLPTNVVAPLSSDVSRDVAGLKVPVTRTSEIVPPPVSAPERESTSIAKLTLPAPGIVAPPPSNVGRDVGALSGLGTRDARDQVVPPPVQSDGRALARNSAGTLLGTGTQQVIAPPSEAGSRSLGRSDSATLIGNSAAVAPPVDSGNRSLSGQAIGGILGGSHIVPPPPMLSGSGLQGGQGSGDKGLGRGGSLDIGSAVAAPGGGGGNGGGSGVVVSNKPGTAVGVPGSGNAGSLAMSPAGGDKPGVGGSGGGAGIGHGTGPGSGLNGAGSGAGREGAGRGSDPSARNGISPFPGPGGAGKGTSGSPAVPGVSVQGGNTVTLPSFGSTNDPSGGGPGRSSVSGEHRGPGITVVATSRSGGAFNFYGALKGDRVYTIYIGTAVGTVVMQYADPASASAPYAEDLGAPDPLRTDLPPGLLKVRTVIACVLDASGAIKSAHILESGNRDTSSRILAALPSWKFRPAMRANQGTEVNAILGFNIDTR